MNRHRFWNVLPLVIIASAAAATAQQPREAPTTSLSTAQWRADLRFMAQEMERRHKNLYHTVSRERFAAAVADLDARIPTIQRNEIIVGMMRIAAMVGDGHTNISPLKDATFRFPSFPLKLYQFEEGLYVRAAAPEYAALAGARVEAIGGVAAAEALRRAAEVSPRDNDVTGRMYAPVYLGMPDILQALGLSASRERAVLTLRKGARVWEVEVPAAAVDPLWPGDTDISLTTPPGWTDARTAAGPPEWLRDPLTSHRLVEMPEQRALYAQLNMVTNVTGETLEEFGARIAQRARAIRPRAIILDLRLDRGGNMDLRFGFVRELIKAETDDTRLFVLVGRGSFSATQAIIDDLDRFSNAVLIGEPASSRPNGYGDSYRIVLPNSGLTVRTSIKWHQIDDGDRPYTAIDIAAPPTFASYVVGRDPALEVALAYVPRAALEEQLLAAANAGGLRAVQATLTTYVASDANRFADVRHQLILAPQSLLAADRSDEALYVAQAATERFPSTPATWAVLGFVAERTGHPDLARSAGSKALALDPSNREMRALMERLAAPTGVRE